MQAFFIRGLCESFDACTRTPCSLGLQTGANAPLRRLPRGRSVSHFFTRSWLLGPTPASWNTTSPESTALKCGTPAGIT